MVGADDAGQRLACALSRQGVRVSELVVDPDRPTTVKTRIMAQNRQLLRRDHEDCRRPPVPVIMKVLHAIDRLLPQVDACILSDYAKGLVFPPVARRLIGSATALGTPVVVDPKAGNIGTYRGATLIKPNMMEAARLGYRSAASPTEVLELGPRLLTMFAGRAILVTCGAAGMTLFEPGRAALCLPAEAREVRDVTGAGDTVTATVALTLAAGARLEQAARLASCAAGLVVGKTGTAVVSTMELARAIGANGARGERHVCDESSERTAGQLMSCRRAGRPETARSYWGDGSPAPSWSIAARSGSSLTPT